MVTGMVPMAKIMRTTFRRDNALSIWQAAYGRSLTDGKE